MTQFGTSFNIVNGPWSYSSGELRNHRYLGEYLTVPDGERYIYWDTSGNVTCIDGPSSQICFGGSSRRCLKYLAGPGEFIVLTRKTGEREIITGPTALWEDPVQFVGAEVYAALEISTNQAIVVYIPEREGDRITRKIVHGPTLYSPTNSQEWLHRFEWHGTDAECLKSRGLNRKLAGGLKFTKLRLVPDQLYFDVEKVRTKDDALLVAKTMIFFRLVDVNKMIEATHDPISDLINSIAADIIALASQWTFEEFRANALSLNDLKSFPTLLAAGSNLGYQISKIVFRGYEASQTLQQMHDEAIELRTRLTLTAESEEQQQELEDLRQRKIHQRSLKDREEEQRTKQHNLKIEEMAHEARLLIDRRVAEQEQSLNETTMSMELAKEEKKVKQREAHLKVLKEMEVDLNNYLSQGADQIIRLEGNLNGGSSVPHLHLDGGSKL